MCHIEPMKTISIRQLHEATGKYVRHARVEPLVVTDRGAEVAVPRAFSEKDVPARPFPKRDPRKLPRSRADSTEIISRDRGER